jgi:hypothetical protein
MKQQEKGTYSYRRDPYMFLFNYYWKHGRSQDVFQAARVLEVEVGAQREILLQVSILMYKG